MRKSLGDKRREISREHREQIVELYSKFESGERCRVFDSTDFGYRKITVERPLRLNFQATPERIERIREQSAFKNLAISRKKDKQTKAREEAEGVRQQQAILAMLATLPGTLYKKREEFVEKLARAEEKADLKLSAPLRKAVLEALSERDETAEICRDKHGNPEPDPELRDYENVPLKEDIAEYFQREVAPHVPDAWVNTAVCDEKDGKVGKVGYEINFNRYFYKYVPPRPLEEIEAEIEKVESEIAQMLKESTR
jgi:type I restriction enzyme M protein